MSINADSPFITARTTEVELEDGLVIGLRPIVPDDREQLAAEIAKLSPETSFLRFFRTVTSLSDRELDYLTSIDYVDHFAWVAFVGDPPRGIGVARYVRIADEPEIAEAAVVVVDEYQNRGIGRLLLGVLAETALVNGITTFRGYALPENRPVLDSAARRGVDSTPVDGMMQLDVRLPPPTGLEGSVVYQLLRQAASGEATFGA